MSDASLAVAAVVGLVLTAGAILRDTRQRIGVLADLAGLAVEVTTRRDGSDLRPGGS